MSKSLESTGTFALNSKGPFANVRLGTDGEHSSFIVGPKHVSVGERIIENVQDGVAEHCAATRGYVDAKFNSLQIPIVARTAEAVEPPVQTAHCRPVSLPYHHHCHSGAQGCHGKKGQAGPQGLVGDKGQRGSCGKEGSGGQRGYRGHQGFIGDFGPQGKESVGVQGRKGPCGDAGDKGHPGCRGLKGEKGDSGLEGPQGLMGIAGPEGRKGRRGLNGEIGEPGLMGSQGNEGIFGPQGDNGSQGFQGLHGRKGCHGEDGERGEQGPQGLFGTQGPLSFTKKLICLSFSTPGWLTDSEYMGMSSSGVNFITQSCVVPFSGSVTNISASIRDNGRRGVVAFQVCISAPDGTNLRHTELTAQIDSYTQSFDVSDGAVAVQMGELVSIRYYCIETNKPPLESGASANIFLVEE